MGTVFLAEDIRLNKKWAVKTLGDEGSFRKNIKKAEISVLRRASHPNLPRITDIFEENGTAFMVMDYIEGNTLEEILNSGRKITTKHIYQWSIEAASALSYLHSSNPPVIYRDMKPANIIVRPSGSIVLIDFGTAKASLDKADRESYGTVRYAAPEQFQGSSDERSDIYSLGKTIEAMAGKGASFWLKRIIKRSTARLPDKRYRSAEEMRRQLVFARDFRKLLAACAFILILALLLMVRMHSVSHGTEKQVERIVENGREQGFYDDALLCFYELKDYEAALGYLRQVSEEQVPEVRYYAAFCEEMLTKDTDRERLYSVLASFREFNGSLTGEDSLRRYKNDINIAQLYLTYGDEDPSCLREAMGLLYEAANAYRQGDASAQTGIRALTMLSTVMRLLGGLEAEERTAHYQIAIDSLKELVQIPEAGEDPDFIERRYKECAALYEEMERYGEAEGIYEKAEDECTSGRGELYLSHLRMLLKIHAPREKAERLCRKIAGIKETADSEEFIRLRERMEKEYEEE
ncbi:MAG: serine/threonine protein kinase [Lachnospiraceae bacterium]|nr:serine/threonine protein kinase [Lachnospiraceae bacterium]